MITRTINLTLALLALATAALGYPDKTIFDDLYAEEPLFEVVIETDLSNLIDNRLQEDYQEARFSFENQNGDELSFDIKVKARGKYRRRVCNFPPVMLNFSKSGLLQQGYIADFDKLKLVTHCLDDKAFGNENVAKEYLAYKMYNLLSDQSYRVQLVKVVYIDSKRKVSRIKRYGMIIEDTDEMAFRIGGEECEDCVGLTAGKLSAEAQNTMAVFQYMIGNADWSNLMMRNVKMVKPFQEGLVIPVPYDFDFSGLVNASYALPNTDYGLVSVKQRAFLGYRAEKEVLFSTLRRFTAQKEELFSLVRKSKMISVDSRLELRDYLDSFYLEVEMILRGEAPQPGHQLLQQALIEDQAPKPLEENNTNMGK